MATGGRTWRQRSVETIGIAVFSLEWVCPAPAWEPATGQLPSSWKAQAPMGFATWFVFVSFSFPL